MATRNIVPRADGEGSLGTDIKKWGAVYAEDIHGDVTGNVTGTASGNLPMVVGAVLPFAGNALPDGWLLCDGSAVSRTDYADLYSVIGDTYGNGDGSTTFNLPNLVDKFVEGSATAGTVKSAGLPNITGSFDIRRQSADGNMLSAYTGVFSSGGEVGINGYSCGITSYDIARQRTNFSASSSNSIYGNSTTVQPPALTMRYIIKY